MNKKMILAIGAFVVLIGVVVGVYFIAGPGKKADPVPTGDYTVSGCCFTVTVVHADGSQKNFSYVAEDSGKLGAFLESEGLISSQGADPGMFHTVDGEKADWNENQSYWAFYIEDDYAMTGIYDTDIADSTVYKLVYTIG